MLISSFVLHHIHDALIGSRIQGAPVSTSFAEGPVIFRKMGHMLFKLLGDCALDGEISFLIVWKKRLSALHQREVI